MPISFFVPWCTEVLLVLIAGMVMVLVSWRQSPMNFSSGKLKEKSDASFQKPDNMVSATSSLNWMTPFSCKAINLYLPKSLATSAYMCSSGAKSPKTEQFLAPTSAARSLPTTSHSVMTQAEHIRRSVQCIQCPTYVPCIEIFYPIVRIFNRLMQEEAPSTMWMEISTTIFKLSSTTTYLMAQSNYPYVNPSCYLFIIIPLSVLLGRSKQQPRIEQVSTTACVWFGCCCQHHTIDHNKYRCGIHPLRTL